jgi:hypothetical protein
MLLNIGEKQVYNSKNWAYKISMLTRILKFIPHPKAIDKCFFTKAA